MVWLTYERHLALCPAGTIVRDPHPHESPTRREQDLKLRRTWVQALLNEVVRCWWPLHRGATILLVLKKRPPTFLEKNLRCQITYRKILLLEKVSYLWEINYFSATNFFKALCQKLKYFNPLLEPTYFVQQSCVSWLLFIWIRKF